MSTLRTDTLETLDGSVSIAVADIAERGEAFHVVDDYAGIRALSKTEYSMVLAKGSLVTGVGGGLFILDPDDTTSAEDLSVGTILATDGGRWKLLNTQGVPSNVQQGINTDDFMGRLGYRILNNPSNLQGNGNKFNHFSLFISTDQIEQVSGVNGATGSKVDGLNVTHVFGGGNTKGGRHAIEGNLLQGFGTGGVTSADNVDRFYVGVQGQVITQTGDGGTSNADTRGAYFGSSSTAHVIGDAYYVNNLTAMELNTEIAPSTNGNTRVALHTGIQLASSIGQNGRDLDAALSVSCLGGSAYGWRNGLHFHALNGAPAINQGGTLIKADATAAVAGAVSYAFDFRGLTMSYILRSDTVALTQGGLNIFNASAFLALGNVSAANSPTIQMSSGGAGAAYDVKFTAGGGTATAGKGVLALECSTFTSTGSVVPQVSNAISCGDSAHLWTAVWATNGTIQTSDERLKDFADVTDAEVKVAGAVGKLMRKWKWKGDDAGKMHFGVSAQAVVAAFQAEGLDALDYAIVQYDRETDRYAVSYAELQSFIMLAVMAKLDI